MRTRNLKGNGSMAKVKQIRLNEWYFHHALKATNRALCLPGWEGRHLFFKASLPWYPRFSLGQNSELRAGLSQLMGTARQLKGVGNTPNLDYEIPEHQPREPQSLPLQLERSSN